METLDFRKQYEAMTNEELLNLAMDSEQLNPEARNSLDSELSRRDVGHLACNLWQGPTFLHHN
jgi:hypothetical protein